jgi:hypothetical protein
MTSENLKDLLEDPGVYGKKILQCWYGIVYLDEDRAY